MKHIKSKDQFILDEGISWEALKTTYRRARGIASKVINAFKQEGRETASMMRVFNYQLRNKLRLDTRGNTPTPDEIKSALEQLKDIPKLAPYAVILLSSPIPFSSTMYTAAAVYLKKVSKGYIDLLPGSFNDVFTPISDIEDRGYIENDEIKEEFSDIIINFNQFLKESRMEDDRLGIVKDLAIRLHGEQKRKYSGDPYYTHLFRVSDTVKEIGGDEAMIMAALLHDVLEDTPTNEIELISELESIVDPQMARDIVNLVIELTDVYTKENFPDLNRRARKEMEAKRLGEVSSRAQTIKYADLLDNGEDIMKNDPSFGRVYLREKGRILNYMRNGDEYLYNKCLSQIS
jgi:hypothetical protein